MAELRIQLSTQQASQAAQTFQKILTDIKNAARMVDDLNFNRLGDSFNRLNTSTRALLTAITSVTTELGRMNYTLQSIRSADHGTKMAEGFRTLLTVIRDLRSEITGLNRDLREAADLSGRVGTASQRVRRTRAPTEEAATPVTAAGAAVTSTAIVATGAAITSLAALGGSVTQLVRLNTEVQSLARSMTAFSQATLIATASVRQFSDIGERAYATYMRLKTVALPAGQGPIGLPQGQQRLALPQGPGPETGIRRYVFEGEAVDRFGTALQRVNQPLTATSRALEETNDRKHRLDRNLHQTATSTLPNFNSALQTTISILAFFTVRALLRELEQLGKTLFEVGRDAENSFAIFRAGARNDVEEGARRMLFASDAAKRLGLDLKQTREDYARLSAAALGSSLEGQKIEKVFLGIAAAQAVLGQNTEKGTGIIKVFTDILGKGRLQSEELVKQLGNIVPGSIRVVAESLKMTTTDLSNAIARGTLNVETVLTSLAAEFEKRYGTEAVKNIQRLGGAFNVLKATINDVQLVMLNAGVGQGLIGGFRTLTDFLNERETRVAIAQLANFITNVLGAAFKTLIEILRVLRDNLNVVIEYFTFLASATFLAGILLTVRAFMLLAQAINAIAAGTAAGRLLLLGALVASFVLGKAAADKFTEGIENATKKIEDMEKEANRLRELQAKDNDNLPDRTRAQIEAQERLDKELRTFNEDLRAQQQSFELAAQGVDTLSLSYEAFGRVLERVRALERSDIFGRLNVADREKARQDVINQFIGPEMQALALQEVAKFKNTLDRAKRELDTAMSEFLTLERVGANEPMLNAERNFERQLGPIREKMQEILFTVDPSMIDSVAAAFQLWATRMHNLAVETENARTRFKMLRDDLAGLRELRIDELITKITLGIQNVNATPNANTSISILEKTAEFLTVSGGQGSITDSLTRFRQETERTAESAKKLASEYSHVSQEVQKISTQNTTGNYQDIINRAGAKFGVDPALISAMIRQESGGDPNAVSKRGAGGLMQLMPGTARQMGVTDVYDPEQNIFGGTKYIKQQLDAFGGNVKLALAAYIAGPGAVQQYGGIPPFKETQNYVSSIMGRYRPGAETIQPLQGGAADVVARNREAFLPDRAGGGFTSGRTEEAIKKTDAAVEELTIDIEKYSESEKKATDNTHERFEAIRKRTDELRRLQRELSVEDTIGLNAVRITAQPDIVSQDKLLNSLSKERFERERLIEVIRVGAQAAKEYGLTQEDVTKQTEKYFAVIERQRVASELYTNERLRQGHMTVLSMQEETQSLQDQLDVLRLEERERGIVLQTRQQQRDLAKQVLTPQDRAEAQKQIEQQAELNRRIRDGLGPLKQYSDSLASFESQASSLEAFQNVAIDLFKGLEDQIVQFVSTGKLNFQDFANSFAGALVRMMLQAAIFKPIIDSLNSSLTGGNGGGGWFGILLKAVGVGVSIAGAGAGGTGGYDFPGASGNAASGGIVTLQGIRHFQGGGFIGIGTDTVPAMLTPGEIILNKSQQQNIADSMQGKQIVVNNNITIQTANADSFRQSQRQVEDEMSRMSYAAMRRAGFGKNPSDKRTW